MYDVVIYCWKAHVKEISKNWKKKKKKWPTLSILNCPTQKLSLVPEVNKNGCSLSTVMSYKPLKAYEKISKRTTIFDSSHSFTAQPNKVFQVSLSGTCEFFSPQYGGGGFFYQVVGIWQRVISTIGTFFNTKKGIL